MSRAGCLGLTVLVVTVVVLISGAVMLSMSGQDSGAERRQFCKAMGVDYGPS